MGETIATNKKAFRDYFLSDKWECGIELMGGEVKSIRAGNLSFKDTFARIEDGQVHLYNLHVNEYKQASHFNLEPDRPRRLLLHKREIRKIQNIIMQQHTTLVPTKLYFNNRGFIKVEIAIGKGKKMYDKRETIKKRTIEKSLKRAMRGR